MNQLYASVWFRENEGKRNETRVLKKTHQAPIKITHLFQSEFFFLVGKTKHQIE